MGMTLYSCITAIAQMSRKRYYLRANAIVVADCCLVWTNVGSGVSLVNIRLLPFSTWHNIKFLRYKLSASINKPNNARLPSLNPKQSEISPLNGEVLDNLRKMLVSTKRREL